MYTKHPSLHKAYKHNEILKHHFKSTNHPRKCFQRKENMKIAFATSFMMNSDGTCKFKRLKLNIPRTVVL